jgi:hypothetical protein
MCDRHKNHWRNRKLLIWLGLLFFVTFFITTAVLYDQIPKDAQTPVIAFGVFGGLFWLLLAMILMNRAIRAGEITNEWIELVHVHKRFRDEWEKVQPEPLPVVRRKRRRPPPREEDEEYDDRDDR